MFETNDLRFPWSVFILNSPCLPTANSNFSIQYLHTKRTGKEDFSYAIYLRKDFRISEPSFYWFFFWICSFKQCILTGDGHSLLFQKHQHYVNLNFRQYQVNSGAFHRLSSYLSFNWISKTITFFHILRVWPSFLYNG